MRQDIFCNKCDQNINLTMMAEVMTKQITELEAHHALMLEERFTVELALENMIEMVEQFIQPCYTKDSLLGIEMSERLRESNQALKPLEEEVK